MKLKFFLTIFIISHLSAVDFTQQNPELTSLTAEPSTIIGKHVNVLTGDFQDFEEDLHVPGPESLHVQRCYCSSNVHIGVFERNWTSNHEAFMTFHEGNSAEYSRFKRDTKVFSTPSGQTYHFELEASKSKDQEVKIKKEFLSSSFTNTSQGVISGQTNPNNMIWSLKNKKDYLKFGNGRIIHYDKVNAHDMLPSGNSYEFRRDSGMRREVTLFSKKNRAIGKVTYVGPEPGKSFKKDPHVVAVTPDGRKAVYRFTPFEYSVVGDSMRSYLLHSVVSDDKPTINYGWECMPHSYGKDWKISRIDRTHGRTLSCQYYKAGLNWINGLQIHLGNDHWMLGRVASISEPLGEGPEQIPSYQFFYAISEDGQERCTGVYNALGYKTDYSYSLENRLRCISRYDEKHNLYSQESLTWGAKNTRQQTHLIARSFKEVASNRILFNRAYHYDMKGNVVSEFLAGQITGRSSGDVQEDHEGRARDNGVDRQIRLYTYSQDDFNLLLSERCGSFVKTFTYQSGTNRLISCFHKNENAIFLRHFYFYDDTGQVIEHIVDNGIGTHINDLQGVSERRFERIKRSTVYPVGLPLEVTETYLDTSFGQEKLLRRTVSEFNVLGIVTKKSVYDSNNLIMSTELWCYDAHGNLTAFTNALGEQWTYGYDENDNRLFECAPEGQFKKRYQYDYMNRLICTLYESADLILSEHNRYDLVGNSISKIDIYGNETNYVYDAFNRLTEVHAPPVEDLNGNLIRPITKTIYDPLSLPVKRTDPEGHTTETIYSILGKPLLVRFPDNSEERFYYDLEGRLVETISKSGLKTQFALDVQGRPINTFVFDAQGELLYQTQAIYNAFHLLCESDPLGVLTTYRYDGAGRKIEEVTADRCTTFLYNAQGLIAKTIISSIEHPEEAVVNVRLYDSLQRVIEERQENLQEDLIQAVRYRYDCKGNRVSEEREMDAGLSITNIQYDALGVPVSRIDPMGNCGTVSCIYDCLNVHGQKVGSIESVDPLGIKTRVMQDVLGRIVLTEKLDPNGKLLQKIRYWFNSLGKCLQTASSNPLNPNDIDEQLVRWEYDALGRVVRQIEGYGSIEQKTTSYVYLRNGKLEKIVKPDGDQIHYYYDSAGRLAHLNAPGISYQYRYDPKGQLIRVDDLIENREMHRTYDSLGNVIHEALANSLEIQSSYSSIGGMKECVYPDHSKVRYHYQAGRLEAVERQDAVGSTLYSHRYLAFDGSGNMLQSSLIYSLGIERREYDLNLSMESIHSPFVDERLQRNATGQVVSRQLNGESMQYSYDALSQLQQESGVFRDSYVCDSRYNRIAKNGKNYRYNALNQLLAEGDDLLSYDANGNMMQEGKNIYRYDALNRLVAIECGGEIIRYEYDAFDRCIFRKKLVGTKLISSKRLIYVGHEEVGSCDEAGAIQELRILGRGIKAEIGAAIAIELQGVVYAPQHDYIGNVIALVNQDGQVCESYLYGAFGEVKFFGKSNQQVQRSILGNPWLYVSKRHDRHLVHFGFRCYLPRIGRFITADPAGYEAGSNPYAYVGNRPLHSVDALGLKEDPINLYDRTHDRSSWEYNSPHAENGSCSRKGEGGDSIFSYISIVWRHIVPIPLLQDLGCGAMHYLNHGSLSNFKPWKESNTTIGVIPGIELRGIAFVLIGGINTSHDELMEMAKVFSEYYGGVKVTFIHNGDHGLVADLLECAAMILDLPVRSVDFAYKRLSEQLDAIGGVEGGFMVKLSVFSQGALTGEKALNKMTPAERALFHIDGYGSAAIIPHKGYIYSKNVISDRDFIPVGASLPNWLAARLGFMKEVQFLPARETVWGVDHRFMSETYQRAMQEDAKKFRNTYQDKY